MSSIERQLSGDVLVFDLDEEHRRLEDSATDEPGTRGARTLLKEGPLRVTLVVLAPGGSIAEHRAQGPITVQPLTGELRFAAAGSVHDIRPGQLLCLEAGIRHSVSSAAGAEFLLTVVRAEAGEKRRER